MDRGGLYGVYVPVCAYHSDGGGVLFGNIDGSESVNHVQAAETTYANNIVTYPDGKDNLGRFPDGYNYSFTDRNNIDQFRARLLKSDLSSVTVDSSAAAGDQTNPYVIADTDDWEAFVKLISPTTGITNGLNKYFVLANDLDFENGNIAFHPAYYFRGTFYGMGRSLKNISVSTWQSYKNGATTLSNMSGTPYGYGVFGGINDATITDLIVENFSFKNMPTTTSGTDVGSRVCRVGGITGRSSGTDSILNCHVSGIITSTTSYSSYVSLGGIIGMRADNSKKVLTIYRCSAEISDAVMNSSDSGIMGGMIGDVIEVTIVRIYDCVANLNNNNTVQASAFGGVVFGYTWSSDITTENVVGTIHIAKNSSVYAGGILALGKSTKYTPTVKIKNIFGEGTCGGKQLYAVSGTTGSVPASSTVLNVHTVKNPSLAYAPFLSGSSNLLSNATHAAQVTNHETNEDVVNAAKDSVGSDSSKPLNSNIWNKDKIGGTYDPDNSPVRNYLKITVSYYDYINGEDRPYSWTENEPKEVKSGESLETPASKPNRTFLGWTTDKTGASEPFKAVPSTMFGDNKLYAVWRATTSSASITAWGAGNELEYGENGYELTYNGEGNGITLTANLTVSDMGECDIRYQWQKGGEAVASGGTAQEYKVENVNDSGNYSVKLTFNAKSEPLFRGEVTTIASPTKVKINPAKIVFGSVYFKEGEHAYSGAPYTSAVPEANYFSEGGEAIVGVTSWSRETGKFNGDGSVVSEGKETKEITFTPDEERYQGNYEIAKHEFEFEIEYLTFTFYLAGYNRENLVVNLEYGQNYYYNNIATMFEEAFAPYQSSDASLGGYTPAFQIGSQKIKINEYRKTGASAGGSSTIAYPAVKTNQRLEVYFLEEAYNVTYNPNNETGASWTEEVGYGIRLKKPLDPSYGNQLFLGWFYEFTDDEGNKSEKQWNFDSDLITHEMELYAKWLEADTLDGLTVEFSPLAQFNAQQPLDPSMMTVTAVFTGKAGDNTLEQKVVLSSDQYKIEYVGRSDNKLHVNADGTPTKVKIKYTFNKGGVSVLKEVELDLTVNPISLDTSVLQPYFKSTAVVYDGTAKSHQIKANVSQRIPQIKSVTYEYVDDSGATIDASNVIALGNYTVIAHFTTTNADYKAEDISATLSIIPQPIELSVTWDKTEFVYNGKVQVPKPTFTDSDGYEVEVSYQLTGDYDAIDAKDGHYSVTVELEDLGYAIMGLQGTVRFTISKATVKIPTQTTPFDYKGAEYDLNNLSEAEYATYFDGFDPNLMTAEMGATGKNAGKYTASVTLKNPTCAEWESGGSGRLNMSWEIKRARLTVNWSGSEFVLNNSVQVPQVDYFWQLYGEDKEVFDKEKDIDYSGDTNAIEVGNYTITVILRSDAEWTRNYELDETKSWSFVIVPSLGLQVVTVEWIGDVLFTFNGSVQRPEYKITNNSGADITDEVRNYISYNDEALSSKWAGDYEATLSLNAAGRDKYFLRGKTSCNYTISKDKDGNGADPNGENPLPPGGGDNGNDNTITGLPLWQLIVGGVSALLFVVCTLKSFGEYGKAKAAKREAKELAAQSYAVNYSFAPLPLLAMGAGVKFLGLEETPWTVIALVAAGLFLVSAVMLFMMTKKRKAAELLLKREQARIAEEKEYAREEEQQRRDNELRMMFAAMQQGGYQQQPMYDDSHIQNLIASTVSALLPAVQQQMALPPAQDPNMYAQSQSPLGYGAPNSEAEALRAQMAAQEERMARQQEQMAAQMAQQQELINQLIQNQAAPAYEEEIEDDVSWLGENDEMISLEESYGALSDEGKRAYYEIGSYIMNKPRTSQNDGRYAVLFKYRGKTVFKLCIKDDAPVLYYPLNGGRGEVRIADPASLGTAKSMIDRCVSAVDNELN